MKQAPDTLALALVLVVGLTNPTKAQDFGSGLAAAHAGDFRTAIQIWTPLAEEGDVDAQINLGQIYEFGNGVSRDYAEAARWYRMAAEAGDAYAQSTMGQLHEIGRGVLQDYTEAARWFNVAAGQGHAGAQYSLAELYEAGRGVPQNTIAAHMWFNIAATNGFEAASTQRDRLTDQMTPTMIEEAQSRARVCMSSGYQDCD